MNPLARKCLQLWDVKEFFQKKRKSAPKRLRQKIFTNPGKFFTKSLKVFTICLIFLLQTL